MPNTNTKTDTKKKKTDEWKQEQALLAQQNSSS